MPIVISLTQKTDWKSTDFMNAADMNRIENNIKLVADYLNSIYCPVPALTVKVSRDRNSIDYLDDINRIEGNLEKIRQGLGSTPLGYLGTKIWTKEKTFDFTDANRLELNTKNINDLAQLVFASFRYSGSYTCGGGGLY